MNITHSQYIASAVDKRQYPEEKLAEIALIGRSNVGKSSLINSLCNRKGLARVSSSPGKTQTINFYKVNRSFYLVDLPGYGYAKVAKKQRAVWGKFIEQYLLGSKHLRQVFQLIDFRHPPMEHDLAFWQWLRENNLPASIIATKLDKVKRSQWKKQTELLQQGFGVELDRIFIYSSETGQGKGELLQKLAELLADDIGNSPSDLA